MPKSPRHGIGYSWTCSRNWSLPAWSSFARRPSAVGDPERLNAHCEELYELIASLNNILNLYMPAGQEAEHRFAMGELPDEVLEICQRLAKLTEMLRGLAELFLNDLSENRQP